MGVRDKYDLVFEEYPDYFFARVEAHELSSEVIEEYQKKIADEIRRHPHRSVLIKRDVPLVHSSSEIYRIPFLVDSLNARGIKYAFVDVNPEQMRTYKLALLYARNRGLDIEVFGDIPSAEKWLREESGNHQRT
jgi:hypothetical protein